MSHNVCMHAAERGEEEEEEEEDLFVFNTRLLETAFHRERERERETGTEGERHY